MNRLRGKLISGLGGPIGVLNDLYFDASQWTVRYLALEPAAGVPGARLIIPAACARIEGIGDDELVVSLKRSAIRWNKAPEAHLLSGREAASLRIRTGQGPARRVNDVLVRVDWSIAGFVVEATSWILPGSPVELAPGAVERLDREQRLLCVNLTQREIQRLPRAAWRMRRG